MVLKKGKRYKSYNFLFYYLPLETLKISPVVSKKISKKAVIRNKIKRRIRHLGKNLHNGMWAVVAKNDVSKSDFEKLSNEFKKINNQLD